MIKLNQINIPYEELKSLVLEVIKNFTSDQFEFSVICMNLIAHIKSKGIIQIPNYNPSQTSLSNYDENRLREIIWDLIIERVITLGNTTDPTWPYLCLTEYGKKVVMVLPSPIPNDPSGYLCRIRSKIPDLDPIIEKYLSESIRTYNINQLLSSTITLGCASEKSLLILIDTYCNTFNSDAAKEKFEKKIKGRFIKTQFDEFSKEIKSIHDTIPKELTDKYQNTLCGIFDMIRLNRNYAGHPSGYEADKDTLFAYLQIFITYCKYIYDLKKYFEENKH